MESILSIAKALGEKNRLRAFLALMDTEELCVCDVGDFLGLAPATVSRHMSILHQAGLIDSEKRGRWVYYSIRHDVDPRLLEWIRSSVRDSGFLSRDRAKIGDIVRLHREHNHCEVKRRRTTE
ncbi:MAG TPA: metalloregulator ArsR/SmtB family transcription factor [Aminivibrio sp.]|uniref:ArsR/SmtB family transcription factor n=1 Tax=Aminivibrio sp. TaxID=1872489 RepID=UPI002B215ECD|nr:metalloregulator ArsR/SmtB family transcription factor [Aminivibrio sp.]MEA4952113.1 metalloregulator ArsR/SmtB family transcription factor [Aminivibrio sp.]HPF86413.1 metalloregulator ArsR/SmtB family transcription factor [Aminivibrio sp.]